MIADHIPEFDAIRFIDQRARIVAIYTEMENKLNAFSAKNPGQDVSESREKINTLREHVEFIYRLQREYETVCRVNLDYVRTALKLTVENNEIKFKNNKLSQIIEAL